MTMVSETALSTMITPVMKKIRKIESKKILPLLLHVCYNIQMSYEQLDGPQIELW